MLSQLHWLSAFVAASLRGVHEGKYLQRFLVRYRRLLGLEKLHDLHQQLLISMARLGTALDHRLRAEYHSAIFAVRAQCAHRAHLAIVPDAGYDIAVRG